MYLPDIREAEQTKMGCGLLQNFDVSSDTLEQLELAIGIVLPWNRSGAKGFRTGTTDEGFSWLELSSYLRDGDGFHPLPYVLNDLPKLFSFVRDWLSSTQRGNEFDTDGSVEEGWRVTQPNMRNCWESAFLRVQTTWIIYGK